MNIILRKNNCCYQLLFSIIAFLEIFYIFKAFGKYNINLSIGIIFFYVTYIFTFVNLLRQSIAMSIALFSTISFYKKKYWKWIFLILIASGFHKSVLIVIPGCIFISLISRKKIPLWFYIILFCILAVFYEYLYDLMMDVMFVPLELIFSEKVSILRKFIHYKTPLGSGMGVRLKILGYTMMLPILLAYRDLSKKNNLIFSIFMFGFIGETIASLNMNFQRIFMYFSFVQVIMIPQCFSFVLKKYDLKKLEIKPLLFFMGFFILIFLGFVNFYQGIDNTKYYTLSLNFDLFNNHSFGGK